MKHLYQVPPEFDIVRVFPFEADTGVKNIPVGFSGKNDLADNLDQAALRVGADEKNVLRVDVLVGFDENSGLADVECLTDALFDFRTVLIDKHIGYRVVRGYPRIPSSFRDFFFSASTCSRHWQTRLLPPAFAGQA